MKIKLTNTGAGYATLVCVQPDDLEHFRSYPTLRNPFDTVMAELRKFMAGRVDQYLLDIPSSYYSAENLLIGPDVSIYLGELRRKYALMKATLLRQNLGDGEHYAGMHFDCSSNTYEFLHGNDLDGEPEPDDTKPVDSHKTVSDYRLLLSTRRMLGFLGVDYYDGPDCKFESNRHPSPAKGCLTRIAKNYLMTIIIPNALLAIKYGATIEKIAFEALDYCMKTGKSSASVDAWETLKADQKTMADIAQKYNFYVYGVKRDGTMLDAEHECYLEKFVSLKCKKNKRFKKSKNADVVADLIKRMDKEPELRKMSHRKLLALGITNRAARMFMKARNQTK